MSAPSARAAPISAKWTRRWSRADVCSWIREPARLTEAGDVLLAMKDGAVSIAGELGELAAGLVAGRGSADEVTIFKSLGMAVEDMAAAHLAYVKAAERGLGRGFVI